MQSRSPAILLSYAMSFEAPTTCDDLLNYRINLLLASSGALVVRLCEGRYGISRREWRLMVVLVDHGPLQPSELALHSHSDRPQVSRAINDLLGKGLVQRVNDAGSGKRARVGLSDKGRALYDELFPQVVKINGRIMQVLTPEQIRAFDETLRLLTESAREVFESDRNLEHANRRQGGSRRADFQPEALGPGSLRPD